MATTTPVPTRLTPPLRGYLKAYAKAHGLTMEALLEEIVEQFVDIKPYEHGLEWRSPASHRSPQGQQQGWKQVNVFLAPEVAAQLAGLEAHSGRSRAAIVYTALFWFAKYMRPPVDPSVTKARAAKGHRYG